MAFSSSLRHLPRMGKRSSGDPETLDPVRRALWDAAGGAAGDWANLSKSIGRNHAYLRQYLWRGTPAKLDEEDRTKLAGLLRVDAETLKSGAKPQREHVTQLQPQQSVVRRDASDLEFLGEEGARQRSGKKDLPILGHVKAGATGLFYDQGEHQGVAMRPEALFGVRNAYAVRVHDMSMFPAFEPNDIVHVNPNLAVVPDNNVVIQLADGQAFVKRLLRRTEKHVICVEWHPEKREVRYDRSQVKFVHMIVRER